MAALTGQGIIHRMSAFTDEDLRIIHDTYQYLSHLEQKSRRRKEAKVNMLKVGAELKERKQFARARKIEKKTKQKRVANYMKKCPAARSIPARYRNGIYGLRCYYFKHFPNAMKKYMPLRARYIDIEDRSLSSEAEAVKKKMRKSLTPVMKEIKRSAISCFKKAKLQGDLKKCYSTYFGEIDSLLFSSLKTSYYNSLTEYGSKEEIKRLEAKNKKPLTPKEKKEAIEELKQLLDEE